MKQIRLDRYLANNGCGTRKEVHALLRSGQVRVNGQPEKSGDRKVIPETDIVLCGGKVLTQVGLSYHMLHKPAGYVSATKDRLLPTVSDLMGPAGTDLFPVGRLDRDTEGLLLMTNDGVLSHRLLSPSKHVPKTYEALVTGGIGDEQIRIFGKGIDIGDPKPTRPARLSVRGRWAAKDAACRLSAKNIMLPEFTGERLEDCTEEVSFVEIVITEGRYHQIKRMFAALGEQVVYLRRTAMGPLTLDESLPKGAFRELHPEEKDALLQIAFRG